MILRLFLQNPDRTFSREQIRSLVWPDELSIDLRTVDVKVYRLRNALKLHRAPDPVASVRGVGYRLKATCVEDYEMWHEQLNARSHRTSGA
jgi:DNA-binding response OmpR family regulator